MTKEEFIEYIKTLPEHITFLISSDEEGNSYRKARISEIEKAVCINGEWETVHPDDIEDYEDEELIDVIVFW